jgi:hypothetical protein
MLESSILKTLVYSDRFNYPLKKDEIWKWLVEKSTKEKVMDALERLVVAKAIGKENEYFFLPGKAETVNLRLKREKISRKKLLIVQRSVKKLKAIPFIKFIGLTGALSMNNADENDDIDLLIITAKDTLWLIRILIWLICPICQIRRRKPKDQEVKDKICFNLFLDEAELEIKEKNLFIAHEICQVKPLLNKDNTYEKFLFTNSWVDKYLPNIAPVTVCWLPVTSNCLLSFLNKIAFRLQYLYMKPKITNEKISLHQAFFHPKNLSATILRGLDKKKN